MAKKVLIIDDIPDEAKMAASVLRNQEISVVTSSCGFDALGLVYDEVPDLIILDVLMPDIGGYELCRMLKADELAREIPVIIYTKLDKNIDKFWAYRSGANGFLNKNAPSDEFIKLCTETMKNIPVSLEVKRKLIEAKPPVLANSLVPSKKDALIELFKNIKEIDDDPEILAIKIFHTIYVHFNYDVAMLCFNEDNKEKKTLYFDITRCDADKNVYYEIQKKISPHNPDLCKEDIILYRDKTLKISDLSDFSLCYEYEMNTDSKTVGWMYLYAKENLNSSQLRLLGTIKSEIEHIMRLRYFHQVANGVQKGRNSNARKLYTQSDFDKMLSYECGWHSRNDAPLGLAFIEIDSLDVIENQTGKAYRDVLVAKVSNALTGCLRDGDFIYRSEDDIFAILMTNSDNSRITQTLEFMISKIEDPILSSVNEDNNVKLNIGVLMYDKKYKNHYEFIDALYDVLDEARHTKAEIIIK